MLLRRSFLWVMLGSLVASAAIGIVIFVVGDFGETQVRLLLTTLVIGVFSLMALASASALAIRDRWFLPLPKAGVAASIMAALVAIAMIWKLGEFARRDGWDWRLLASLAVVAFGAGHISMLTTLRLRLRLASIFRLAAMSSAAAVAVLLIFGILVQPDDTFDREAFVRLLGVLLILDVLANVSLLLLVRFASGRSSSGARPSSRGPTRVQRS